MDKLYEQNVGTYKTVQYRSVGALTYMSGVLALIMLLTSQVIPCIVLIVVAIIAFYFKRYLYVEYEYKIVNGKININKVIGKNKKINITNFNAKDMEILAPEGSKYIKALAVVPKKEIKVYPITCKDKIYSAIVKYNEQRVQLKFVPDEKFINLCYKYNPNNVKNN